MGTLLTVSSRGLALGKRLVEGAFHLPGVHIYSPASALYPGWGIFAVVVRHVPSHSQLGEQRMLSTGKRRQGLGAKGIKIGEDSTLS